MGGGDDVGGEGRVVAAAVLGVQDQRQVQRLRLEPGVAPALAREHEDVLGGRLRRVGVADHQRAAVVVVGLRLVGVGGDGRNRADEVNGLREAGLERQVVGRGAGVIGVGEEHRAGERIHEVLRRVLHDRVLLEAVGELAVGADAVLPVDELTRRRQLAEEEQVRGLLVAEPVLAAVGLHDVAHVDAAVVQLARHRAPLAFVHHVAVHVADCGKPHQHTDAGVVAQTPLDPVLAVEGRVDVVLRPYLLRLGPQPFLIIRHNE